MPKKIHFKWKKIKLINLLGDQISAINKFNIGQLIFVVSAVVVYKNVLLQ